MRRLLNPIVILSEMLLGVRCTNAWCRRSDGMFTVTATASGNTNYCKFCGQEALSHWHLHG